MQKIGRIEMPQRQQQAPNDPLVEEASYLVGQLEQMRQSEGQARHQYINSYIGLVTDVAKRLYVNEAECSPDNAITSAIDFAEALRPRIQDYSISLMENIPADALLQTNIQVMEGRLAEIQKLMTKMPEAVKEEVKDEQQIIHEETSSGLCQVIEEAIEGGGEVLLTVTTPTPFTNI